MSDLVLVEHDGPISVLTINRPDKMNALNREVFAALEAGLLAVKEQGSRCLIITGAGKAFVAGADIAAMQTLKPAEAQAFSEVGHRIGELMESMPFPIIAAINGYALGGGCELSLACDFSYGSTRAKFGQPEVTLGVIPGFGGTQRLLRRVGVAMARELVYTGKIIGAEEALRIGLINAVFEPDALMDAAKKTAFTIAKMGPIAVAASKTLFIEGPDRDLYEANALEAKAFGACFGADQQEGMDAFLNKRKPTFKGV